MSQRAIPFLLLLVIGTLSYLWFQNELIGVEPLNELIPTAPETVHNPAESISKEIGSSIIVEREVYTVIPPDKVPDGAIVKGRVKNQLGHGVGEMHIEIGLKVSSALQKQIYSSITDETGHFLFKSIPPDSKYRLEVLASGGYVGTWLDPFPITNDMSAVEIILEGIELTSAAGFIANTDYNPIANFEFLVQNVDIAYPGREIVSDASGFFQLDEFPIGDLHLYTIGDENFQITGITLQPSVYPNLTLVFDKGDYHLSGWVVDEFDAPIAQARVEMTSVVPNLEYSSTSYRFEVTDRNGNFEFSNLGGQKHRIVVEATGYDIYELDYRFQFLSNNLNIRLQRAL